MRKLLIIGSKEVDVDLVKAAKHMGLYTICCDANTDMSCAPAKVEANEYWNIDYSDTESIAEKCRLNHVDGVMAGYAEFRILAAAKIADAIGKPFYASVGQIELTRNKRKFKELCLRYGVPVPQDYCLNYPLSDKERREIEYPVIVKPVDNGGRNGITICWSEQQLDSAIEKALANSICKKILIESYMVGTELAAIYTLADGQISLSLLNEKYGCEEYPNLCNFALASSKYYDLYRETVDPGIRNLLRGIQAQNGVCFFQLIAGQNGIAAFEMGYRLNGGNDWKIISRANGLNYMEMLIQYSLTGKMGSDLSKDNCKLSRMYGQLLVYGHGGIIGNIDFNTVKEIDGVEDVVCMKKKGMFIPENGTTAQTCGRIILSGESRTEISALIDSIYENIILEDQDGNSIKFAPFDSKRIFC